MPPSSTTSRHYKMYICGTRPPQSFYLLITPDASTHTITLREDTGVGISRTQVKLTHSIYFVVSKFFHNCQAQQTRTMSDKLLATATPHLCQLTDFSHRVFVLATCCGK